MHTNSGFTAEGRVAVSMATEMLTLTGIVVTRMMTCKTLASGE